MPHLDQNRAGSTDAENNPPIATNNPATPSIPLNQEQLTDDGNIPKGRLIAHHNIRSNKLAFISFDIKTGGQYCDILQLSAEIVRIELSPKVTAKGGTIDGDSAANVSWNADAFNSYGNPGCWSNIQ